MIEILEDIGEQVTWEMLKCEGTWYVWLSDDHRKVNGAGITLPLAVAAVAADWVSTE